MHYAANGNLHDFTYLVEKLNLQVVTVGLAFQDQCFILKKSSRQANISAKNQEKILKINAIITKLGQGKY